MKKIFLICTLLLSAALARTQAVFPYHLTDQVNSLLHQAALAAESRDHQLLNTIVSQIDGKLSEAGPEFPVYRGLITLFLWGLTPTDPAVYREKALELLKGNGSVLVDSCGIGLYNAMSGFFQTKRVNDWMAVDQQLRSDLARDQGRKGRSFLISGKLEPLLEADRIGDARSLAAYEYWMNKDLPNLKPMEKMDVLYCQWMIIQCDMAQFRWTVHVEKEDRFLQNKAEPAGPEYARLIALDFPAEFRRILYDMDELEAQVIDSTKNRQSPGSRMLRAAYLQLYEKIFDTYYTWAFLENKESYPILPYRNFIYYKLNGVELNNARADSVAPVIDAHTIVNHYLRLSTLYGNVGNTTSQARVARDGFELLRQNRLLQIANSDSLMRDLAALKMAEAAANAADRDYGAALENIRYAMKAAPKPKGNTDDLNDAWELFMNLRMTEVDILLETSDKRAARDSMKSLFADLADIDDDHGGNLYTLPAWNRAQFMVAKLEAAGNRWKTEILGDLFSWMNPTSVLEKEYMTEARLLYVISQWRYEKKLDEQQLRKLLFYTGERLRYSFRMLTAAERMWAYEHKLSRIFDLYHELLFTGKLDKFRSLKQEAISQSLSLKAMLADGNMIPNSFFPGGNTPEGIADIEDKRRLKREISLLEKHYQFQYGEMDDLKSVADQGQELWLNLIAKAYRDSMDRLVDWKNISRKLQGYDIYTEFVRYNQSLGDSSACYGVYIIEPGDKISLKTLFPEVELKSLITDLSASPQNNLLSTGSQRGLGKRKQEGENSGKSWKAGDPDRLAQLILAPLFTFLQGKSNWMIVQDGLLNRISFNALQQGGRHLFQDYLLHQFSSSATFLAPQAAVAGKENIFIAGGLDYGSGSQEKGKRILRRGFEWDYLPATKTEADQVATLAWKANILVEDIEKMEFPDSILKKWNQFRFIHLATHGFYLDSSESIRTYSPHLRRSVYRDDPLFRCGLVVSGANQFDTDIEEDGYLMGYELANTDLRNCQLISLSACETGLGDVRNNLGVDGLPRALKLGGARFLLISLWKVPDEPTAEFMKEFYSGIFAGDLPALALQKTQQAMAKKYPVSAWAAFILVD